MFPTNQLLKFKSRCTTMMSHAVGISLIAVLCFFYQHAGAQQKKPSRIMLQGFWWGSWHDTYPNGYYNYLTRLAPRLRELGIDAIWVFPPQKAGQKEEKMQSPAGLTYPKFYESFDHYDLGDKYQKGTTATRGGTKDEYLRMIAVMHANGIDVIQDIVLNHVAMGGPYMHVPYTPEIDPAAPTWNGVQGQEADFQKSKKFRYVSYATPVNDNLESNYGLRSGRWPKNFQNFHPNPIHPCSNFGDPSTGDPVCNSIFGNNLHDLCMFSNAVGYSSAPNDYEDPNSLNNNYTRDRMAEWIVWFKKQSGFDGVRLDAVKHLEQLVTKDMIDQLQNSAGWASGGEQMFAVGEYIDSKGVMDAWINQEQQRSGTFDFSLREGIRQMVIGNGFFDMDGNPAINAPGLIDLQQNERARTVPVVNNHDSFRPEIDPNTGLYTDYTSGNPFLAPINPDDPRMAAAYAVACAVDGTPDIFIEDLFKLNTGNRYTHDPQGAAQLTVRDRIANIIWAHQVMDWKNFAYKVRTAPIENPFFMQLTGDDVLVIEREGRAIIAINDNGANDGEVWVNCGFPVGTQLYDYSGQFGLNNPANYVTVQPPLQAGQPNRALIKVRKVDPANGQYGYAIWAKANDWMGVQHNPIQRSTTQEWEMADDLGDSHPLSLKQGGTIPSHYGLSPINPRTVGRIYSEAGKNIHLELYPTGRGYSQFTIALYNSNGTKKLSSVTQYGNSSLDFVAPETGFYTIKVWQSYGLYASKVFVKATYTAPQIVDPLLDNVNNTLTVEENAELKDVTVTVYPNPAVREDITINYTLLNPKSVRLSIHDLEGRVVCLFEEGQLSAGTYEKVLPISKFDQRSYIYRLETEDGSISGRIELVR